MQLYRFYPTDFVRQYVVAKDADHLSQLKGVLFADFLRATREWLVDSDDPDDVATVDEMREKFALALSKAEAQPITFIDENY